MVTWEMPDGTEFHYLGSGVSNDALREFVLRFMAIETTSWDVGTWDERKLETAFQRRFGKPVQVTRERKTSGFSLVFRPVLAGA